MIEKLRDELDSLINFLKSVLEPYHDATEHSYQEDPEEPGICKICGWLNEEKLPKLSCGHTHHDHAQELLNYVKLVRASLNRLDESQTRNLEEFLLLLAEIDIIRANFDDHGFFSLN